MLLQNDKVFKVALLSLVLGVNPSFAGSKSQVPLSQSSLTADDQAKGTDADVEVSRKIRRQIVKSDTLSTAAKNIKIITLNGVVTLKGSVQSADEKSKIEKIASSVIKSPKTSNLIRNELEVGSSGTTL